MPSPKSVASWVLCRGLGKTLDEMTVTIPHDLYVFGSQENSVCDREWVESLRAMLKEQTELDYKPVRKTAWNKDLKWTRHYATSSQSLLTLFLLSLRSPQRRNIQGDMFEKVENWIWKKTHIHTHTEIQMIGSSLSFVCCMQIAVQTLWNIKIAVLVKPEHENRISHVGMSSVKTGIANTLGNNCT